MPYITFCKASQMLLIFTLPFFSGRKVNIVCTLEGEKKKLLVVFKNVGKRNKIKEKLRYLRKIRNLVCLL